MTFLRSSWCALVFVIGIMSMNWGVQRGGTAQAKLIGKVLRTAGHV